MRQHQFLKIFGSATAFTLVILMGMLITSRHGQASQDGRNEEESEIRRGFAIAPVPLNLEGKNRALVGLGSYIVNGQGDCNGCHSAGPPTEFIVPKGNPYFLSPPFSGKEQINPATYLGGGNDFGGYPAPDSPLHIISRNLTPDKTGRPEGGNTFEQFVEIIRTGVDMDHLHPTCTGDSTENCVPFPFDGSRLQIMPWPVYRNMTNHDLRAIYEYLSAVPCIEGPATPSDLPPPAQYAFQALHNDCE